METENTPPSTFTAAVPSFVDRFLGFLNSNLGMWFLSSVVLTGGAALIQQVQLARETRSHNHQVLMTHMYEIQSRIDNMQFLVKRSKTVGDAKKALKGLFKSFYPLSNDLENRNLNSLYFTAHSLLNNSQQIIVEDIFGVIKKIEEIEFDLQSEPEQDTLNTEFKKQLENLVNQCQKLQSDIKAFRREF